MRMPKAKMMHCLFTAVAAICAGIVAPGHAAMDHQTSPRRMTSAELISSDRQALQSGEADAIQYAAVALGFYPNPKAILTDDVSRLPKFLMLHSRRWLNGHIVADLVASDLPAPNDAHFAQKSAAPDVASTGSAFCSSVTADFCIEIEPSILRSGCPPHAGVEPQAATQASKCTGTQYAYGPRYFNGVPFCVDVDGSYVSGTEAFTWSIPPTFGGHAGSPHQGFEPTALIARGGTAPSSAGAYKPPVANATYQLSYPLIPSEEEAGLQTKFTFPEVTPAIELVDDLKCDYVLVPPVEYKSTGYAVLEMNVTLSAMQDYTSQNKLTTLTIQHSGNSHPDSAGYTTATNSAALINMVEKYSLCMAANSTSGNLSSQAISIVDGGLYDIKLDWKSPHAAHRAGENTDIGISGLDQVHLNCLHDAYTAANLTTPYPPESLIRSGSNWVRAVKGETHVHLWDGEAHIYPTDETSLWASGGNHQ